MQTLTAMPESFSAGTTVTYTRSLPDYPADDGWTLAVYLRGASAANAQVTPVGKDFQVTFPATVTAVLDPGSYTWLERVTKAGESFDVDAPRTVAVLPNVAAAGAGELQTHAERTLAALRAKRDDRLTKDQETIQIDGMAISRIPYEQLEEQIRRYQAIVNAERRGGLPRVTPIAFSRYR